MFPPKTTHKNLRKLAFSGFAIACLTSSAYADSTYILQLGTADTKEKAEQKWEELKSKNPDILGSLKVHISEVAMGQSDKVTYRTQAGPIDSQASADQLCSKLLDKGNECYVIETAMFASDEVSGDTAANTSGKTRQPEIIALPTHDLAESAPSSEKTASATPHRLIVPARAPRFLDEGDADALNAATQPSEAMVASASAPTPAAEPFASANTDEENEKPAPRKARRAAKAGRKVVADNDNKTTKKSGIIVPDRAPRYLDDDESGEQQVAAKAAPAEAEATPLAVATPVALPDEAAATPTVKVAENKPGFFARLFGASSEEKKLPPAPPTPEAAAAEPESAPAAAPAKEVVGNVSVAEAIRVPLTKGDPSSASAAPMRKQLAEAGAQDNKNYWVQITYFADEHQAHYFYESFRNTYPDISDDVRMRITRSKGEESGQVTLKLGTFSNPAYINAVCSLAAKHSLHCAKIADRTPTPNIFNSGADDFPAQNTFWVQLGAYTTSEEAWSKWQSIKSKNEDLVSGSSAIITTPALSNGEEKHYHLRAGPFSNQSSANDLCAKLTQAGESCSVAGEQ
ncbi:MAG TPA: SPOR domain-containing protein [Rickettsiales bacterium]|nr:SPOR domain-containing protein [Rickettsiales bacterium]